MSAPIEPSSRRMRSAINSPSASRGFICVKIDITVGPSGFRNVLSIQNRAQRRFVPDEVNASCPLHWVDEGVLIRPRRSLNRFWLWALRSLADGHAEDMREKTMINRVGSPRSEEH